MPQILIETIHTIWSLFAVIAIHELGHFLAAYVFKLPISSFNVGIGPRLMHFSWKGMQFRLHALPVMGSVRLCWVSSSKWKNILLFAAGPLANLALCALILIVFGPPINGTAIGTLYLCSLIIGAVNLLPFRSAGIDSDGSQILKEFTKKRRKAA